MGANGTKKTGLLAGVAVKSVQTMPYACWMSIHGRDLAAAVEYDRECMILKRDSDKERIHALIGGEMAYLKSCTLTNGLVAAIIQDKDGKPIYDANEYGGITAVSDGNNKVRYGPVIRMANIAYNAILENGFLLKYLDADPEQKSIYNQIRRDFAPSDGIETFLEYTLFLYGDGSIALPHYTIRKGSEFKSVYLEGEEATEAQLLPLLNLIIPPRA